MALSRRQLLMLATTSALAAACATGGPGPRSVATNPVLRLQAGPPGAGIVLVCMPDTRQTREVLTGLSDEIGSEFGLVGVRVDGASGAGNIASAIEHHRPNAVVLMNNPTVRAYRAYLERDDAVRGLPAVVVMSSFLKERQLRRIHALGVSYEVPLITAVTNLRRILSSEVVRVGVVLRSPLADFIQEQRALAAREQIEVSQIVVSREPNASELKRALRLLKRNVDAIWVLNDDRLLTPRLIADGWLPGLNERPWRPSLVGAASLVVPDPAFGTLAVLPDHTALGIQAANLVFEIADNDWKLARPIGAELPLSTTTSLDVSQAEERFVMRDDALTQVDRLIE